MPELEKVVSSSDFDDWFSLNDTIMGGSSKAVCRASSKGLSLEGVVVEEKLGTRTTLDVINAEQSLLDARTQLASAEREHTYARFALLAATGELNLKKLKITVPKIN